MLDSTGSDERGSPRIPLAAITFIGVATLAFEILLTRIFSVTMWYHFAFVAISLALFGIAASGVFVTLAPNLLGRERAMRAMAVSAFLFGVAIPLGFVFDLGVPFLPFDSKLADDMAAPLLPHVLFFVKFIALSVPFFFSGLCIALAFTHAPARVHPVYFADLAGGAAGCLLSVILLLMLSGPSAVILTAAFAFAAAALFFRQDGSRRGTLVSAGAAAAVVAFVLINEGSGTVAISRVKSYKAELGQVGEKDKVYERWHPVSRVAVHPLEVSESPRSWFYTKANKTQIPKVMEVTNDAGARTFIWPEMTQEGYAAAFRDDLSDQVYAIAKAPKVLIVGVGGGKDVLSALAFGCASVTAVELNPLMIDIVQNTFAEFSGRPYDDPRVRVVIDEARNFVATRDDRYDVIKISVTDTWAASAGGAYALTESYLYTTEAMHDFLDHLSPGGYLSITRWYPQESYRLVALVAEALRARGVQSPEAHVLMASNGLNLTLIVKNEPVTAEEEAGFIASVKQAKLKLVWAPNHKFKAAPGSKDENHRDILKADDLDAMGQELGFNIAPPTDDRPFFFNLVTFESAQKEEYGSKGGFILQHGRALALLVGLLEISAIVALLFVLGPLLLLRGKGSTVRLPQRLGTSTYFLLLGLGFLMVEVPLVQVFILFLGHPTYAVTVVLFSLLVTSGIGSLMAGRYDLRRRAPLVFVAIVAVVVLCGLLLPSVLRAMIGFPIAVRVVIAVLLITPIGLLLGTPFPMGVRAAHDIDKELVPWAWAVNGAASVAAPVVAMLIAILAGFSVVMYAGAAIYAAAALAFLLFGRSGARAEVPAATTKAAAPKPTVPA